MRFSVFLLFALLLWACGSRPEADSSRNRLNPEEVQGYIVPLDSIAAPKQIQVDEGKLKKIPAGQPRVIPTNTNLHPAGTPEVLVAGIPRISVPGTDSFALPKEVPAIHKPVLAGIPEVVAAKEAYIKDQNPESFSIFTKRQGLKHNSIRCILQDRSGNLWFGTDGNGLVYSGDSVVIDALGNVHYAGESLEIVKTYTLNAAELFETRKVLPFLKDA